MATIDTLSGLYASVQDTAWCGTDFTSYRLQKQLAEGGSSLVFQASRQDSSWPVVVKWLRAEFADDSEIVERFYSEAQMLSRLRHPSIPRLLDQGTWMGSPFLVCEYVHGEDLASLLTRSSMLRVFDIVQWMQSLCEIVHSLHQQGLAHRDLKLDNIMLGHLPGRKFGVALVDFALASEFSSEHKATSEQRYGTLPYMAPEAVIRGEVSVATEIYALGVVLCVLCTDDFPYWQSRNYGSNRARHLELKLPPRVAELAPPLRAVLERALCVHPERRYANALQFASDLAEFARGS